MMAAATRVTPLRLVAGRDSIIAPRGALVAVPITTSGNLSQLPAAINISAYRGDDLSFTLTVTDTNNNPVDVTGWTVLSQVRSKPDAPDPPMATFTSTIATSVITLTLTHTVSAGLGVGLFVWDCQLTDLTGKVHTIAAGTFSLTADVSR
jgi:hypothetical protein